MKKFAILFLALAILPVSRAFADGDKVITLKDGSRITGHVVGMDQGQYIIQNGTLGEVKISQDNIQSIIAPNMAGLSDAPPSQDQAAGQGMPAEYTQQMKAMQSQIVANPDLMKEIATLTQDPEIMNLLNDPALLEAAKSGNPQAMQSNPRTQQLMSNPKMQELIRKIQQAQGGQQQPSPQPQPQQQQ